MISESNGVYLNKSKIIEYGTKSIWTDNLIRGGSGNTIAKLSEYTVELKEIQDI